MNRLYKYEEGQYGLSDALREMQDCRLQINIRDKQIAELIQNCNKLQSICDEVEHENLTLRQDFIFKHVAYTLKIIILPTL